MLTLPRKAHRSHLLLCPAGPGRSLITPPFYSSSLPLVKSEATFQPLSAGNFSSHFTAVTLLLISQLSAPKLPPLLPSSPSLQTQRHASSFQGCLSSILSPTTHPSPGFVPSMTPSFTSYTCFSRPSCPLALFSDYTLLSSI
jgi:hypothetical protein